MDVMQGTLDAMVLKALSWGPMHGYAVTRWIRNQTDGTLEIDDAAMYQALHRMERRGWLKSQWGISKNKRKAKYYTLTKSGQGVLANETKTIRRYVTALLKVLESDAATQA